MLHISNSKILNENKRSKNHPLNTNSIPIILDLKEISFPMIISIRKANTRNFY